MRMNGHKGGGSTALLSFTGLWVLRTGGRWWVSGFGAVGNLMTLQNVKMTQQEGGVK